MMAEGLLCAVAVPLSIPACEGVRGEVGSVSFALLKCCGKSVSELVALEDVSCGLPDEIKKISKTRPYGFLKKEPNAS